MLISILYVESRSKCYAKMAFKSGHCFTSVPDIFNEK